MSKGHGQRVLPCPFCGGPAKVHKQFDGFRKIRGYYISCNRKGCPIFASTRVKKSKAVIIEEWNTRANKNPLSAKPLKSREQVNKGYSET
jgi:Lar family restriction alleviation protein